MQEIAQKKNQKQLTTKYPEKQLKDNLKNWDKPIEKPRK